VKPLALPPNPVHRFYRGGSRIADFRGVAPSGDHAPEDWVGSLTAVHGSAEDGVSRLDSGELLTELAARDPEALLGPAGPGLLVKLLDAGERLPVHFHPDRRFARDRLGAACGKTEAWFVISTERPDACVWLGLSRAVDAETLGGWVERQDREALLGALNRVPVEPGDTIFVPAGLLHAIGEGVLICELQEPSDLSVLFEWQDFDLDGDPFLGLGLPGALSAARRDALTAADLQRLRGDRGGGRSDVKRLFPNDADAFFRAERIRLSVGTPPLPQELSVLVVLEGKGLLATREGRVELRRGVTALIPWAAGDAVLEGELDLLRCMPPQVPA
jgi:mannose-6-phosphate isomerase